MNSDFPSKVPRHLLPPRQLLQLSALSDFSPLLAFIAGLVTPYETYAMYLISSLITAGAFFLIGATKSFFVERRWYRSGLETLLIGGTAALLAYIVGILLKGITA